MTLQAIITVADTDIPDTRVAGVSLLQRAILTCRKAHITDIIVFGGMRLPEWQAHARLHPRIRGDEAIRWVAAGDDAVPVLRGCVTGDFLLIPVDGIFQPELLAVWPSSPEHSTIGLMERGVSGTDRFTGFARCSPDCLDGSRTPEMLQQRVKQTVEADPGRRLIIPPALYRRVDGSRASVKTARNFLFSNVTKPTSGFISRRINSRFSIPFSKLLVDLPVTPNNVSLFTMFIGIAAALLLTVDAWWALGLSGLLWQTAAITDRSDGEIARVKHLESVAGAWFDTTTDQTSYLVYYLCCLYGMYQRTGSVTFVYFGLFTLAVLGLAVLVMMQYLRRRKIGSLQMYSRDIGRAAENGSGGIFWLLSKFSFMSKRDFFSFVFMWVCVLNMFQGLYWILTIGSLVVAAGVFLSSSRVNGAITAEAAGT